MTNDIEVALTLKRELELYDAFKDRSVLIKALRDQFLLARYNASLEVEKKRLMALDVLVNRMTHMSDNMLLRTIELLSQVGGVDMSSITKGVPGPLVSLQQNLGVSVGQGYTSGGNPVRATGELLESLEHISSYFRNKTINLNAEDITDSKTKDKK